MNCSFNGSVGYNSSVSNVVNLTIINYLFNPALNGTESITTISGYSSPKIQNNRFCSGCGYLTQGWSNSTNWKLTFTYSIPSSGCAIVPLIIKGVNQRDYNYIQLVTFDFDLGTGGTGSFSWSVLSSASYLSIGLDYWAYNNVTTYIKNIKVVQV